MAHNLATIGGRVAMAYQGETPWHQLGTRIEHGIDIAAALEAANLNWQVSVEALYLRDGRAVTNRRAVVRDIDREILGTVSGWFKPIQHADAFGAFSGAMSEFGLTVEAAGALGKGEKAWMLFRLPSTISPVDGDDVNGYGVAITGHDGKTAYEFRPTPVRVICQNTLDAAVGVGGNKGRIFSVAHIGNVDKQVDLARDLVRNVLAAMQETGRTFAAMARHRMTPAQVIAFVEGVFPTPEDGKVTEPLADRRATVADLMWTGVGSELARSATEGDMNVWAAYNAVSEYFDHVATGAARTASAQRIANRSAIFGSGSEIKLEALRRAQQLVAA